jgi:hypothetical protein
MLSPSPLSPLELGVPWPSCAAWSACALAAAPPLRSSVSGSPGRTWQPAIPAQACPVSWADDGPAMTLVVRCGPVVLAPMWPQRSRAWKARPCTPLTPDGTPVPQVRPSRDGPLLTLTTRQVPMLRARGGHGRRVRPWLRRGSDGHKLNRRVRPVRDGHLPCWQAAEAARQPASSVRERIRC